jgi:hypothetical protein
MPRKHMRTVGISDVVIAIVAIIFVAAYVAFRSYERRLKSGSGPWIQENKRLKP